MVSGVTIKMGYNSILIVVRHKKAICDECAWSLLAIKAAGEAAEFVYCPSSHLRLTECDPLNYCLYKIRISELGTTKVH